MTKDLSGKAEWVTKSRQSSHLFIPGPLSWKGTTVLAVGAAAFSLFHSTPTGNPLDGELMLAAFAAAGAALVGREQRGIGSFLTLCGSLYLGYHYLWDPLVSGVSYIATPALALVAGGIGAYMAYTQPDIFAFGSSRLKKIGQAIGRRLTFRKIEFGRYALMSAVALTAGTVGAAVGHVGGSVVGAAASLAAPVAALAVAEGLVSDRFIKATVAAGMLAWATNTFTIENFPQRPQATVAGMVSPPQPAVSH